MSTAERRRNDQAVVGLQQCNRTTRLLRLLRLQWRLRLRRTPATDVEIRTYIHTECITYPAGRICARRALKTSTLRLARPARLMRMATARRMMRRPRRGGGSTRRTTTATRKMMMGLYAVAGSASSASATSADTARTLRPADAITSSSADATATTCCRPGLRRGVVRCPLVSSRERAENR